MLNPAPIALFCYKRLDVLIKTVEALKNNVLAKDSRLFIFSDRYKDDKDKNDVEKVREYIHTINGFKEIKIIEAEQNYGLANSIINGVTKIVNEYGKIIVVEDDLLTSPYFLKYMNDALNMYGDDERVCCISGYVYPIKTSKQAFFINGADCWGWATTKKGWETFEPDGNKLLAELKEKNLESKFNFNDAYHYLQMLEDFNAGKNNSWAIRWYASAFLKNKLCLYPGKSLIRNIGFGVAGATHCDSKTDEYDVAISQKPVKLSKIDVKENPKDRELFERSFKISSGRIKKSLFWEREKFDNVKIIKILGFIKIKCTKTRP